jgi:hypothetical protein
MKMKTRGLYLISAGLVFALFLGCDGGSLTGSSSGYQSIVGTWNEASYTGDGVNLPTQIIFNQNGKGSYSGTISGSANFSWTYYGTTITIMPTNLPNIVLQGPQVGTVTSPLTVTTSTGGTAIYNR